MTVSKKKVAPKKPEAMKQPDPVQINVTIVNSVNLGERQRKVEATTTAWRAARDAKFAADQAYEAAVEARETAVALFRQDVKALHEICGVEE